MSSNINMGAIKDMVDKKDFKAALSEIKKIDVEGTMNPQFMVLCGRVYSENKKYDEARKTLISAHILAPKSEQVIDEIIRLYLKIGYFSKAKQYYQIFSELVPIDSIEGQKVLYNVRKALQAPDDELIGILQGILNKEYIDELAFELALLYRKAGMNEESAAECDKIRDSFAQSNLYVKWAKPLKMGSINVSKAFNCYPKDEVAEQSGSIYQYVQKENEQLKKDYLELVGSAGGASAAEEDDSIIVDSLDDDDAISVDAEITETATVGGGSNKSAFVHPPDEEIEVEIIEEGSDDSASSDTLMIEDEAAKEKEATGEDIKAALDKIAKAEKIKEEEEAKRKAEEEAKRAEEEAKRAEEEAKRAEEEAAKKAEEEAKRAEEEAKRAEEEAKRKAEEEARQAEEEAKRKAEEEAKRAEEEAKRKAEEEARRAEEEARRKAEEEAKQATEEDEFDMADENKPKLSLKLAGGGGGGMRGGGANRSSFGGGGGMRGGMGGQILSKEEREFMANYDDSKAAQREAAAKERARQAKEAMAAEAEKAAAAAAREEMERQKAEALAKAEAEKKAKEDALKAEQEAEIAKQRAEAEAQARAEAEEEANRRAETEARARAEQDAKNEQERKIQEERERALEEERARKAQEEKQAAEEAARKAEEARKEAEAREQAEREAKLEAERKAEEERAAKALAEQEKLRNSVSRARSKADQEREDAIAAIRAKVEAERAAKEEKKRKAQQQLDDQERRRIKKMPAYKRKTLSQDLLDRLGLAIDDKGELIDPPPKAEEAKVEEAKTEEAKTEEAKTEEAKPQENADGSVPDSQENPNGVEVNAGREAEESDNLEVNAGREAEETDNIEVNAGREAEEAENVEVNAGREAEAEGVKVEDDGMTLGNVGLAGGSLSGAGLEGGSINRDGHSDVTLENAAFAGDKLVTDATFEEEQKLKEEEEAKKAEEEAARKAEEEAKKAEEEAARKAEEEAKKAEEEAARKAEEEAKKAEEEAARKAEEEAKKAEEEAARKAEEEAKLAAEAEEEIEEEAEVEVVETEASGEVIELGAEPEPISDVVEVKDEPKEEEVGEPKVIDGVEIDAYGVPVAAKKHVGKYAASVEFRRQFRTTFENIVEKKGIYRNLVVLSKEGDKVSNVAIEFARAYHDIGLCEKKVATIKASVLNRTDLSKVLPKLKGGCLVIEHAGEISDEKAARVYEVVNNPENEVVLMLVGDADSVNEMFKRNEDLNSLFHSIMLLHNLSDKDLADISVAFMAENGYKLDDEGVESLMKKLGSMEHKGVDNVLAMVADALNKAEQRAKDTLGDVVFNGDMEDGELVTVKGMDFE